MPADAAVTVSVGPWFGTYRLQAPYTGGFVCTAPERVVSMVERHVSKSLDQLPSVDGSP